MGQFFQPRFDPSSGRGHRTDPLVSPYRFLDHTADVGIVATGPGLAEAFASAGEGLAALLCDPETVEDRDALDIRISSVDEDSLLVDWLSEINYRFEVDRFAFRRFKVEDIGETALRAIGCGEPLDLARHHVGEQIKAVTYHQLEIKRQADGVTVRVIFDV